MFSRRLAASIAIAGAVTALAACGSDSSSDSATTASSSQAGSKGATAIKPGKAGGKLTVLASADVDYLDPGQTYYTFGYMVHYAVNRTLYSFKPDNPEKPVEDLAAGSPEISSDNKTVTVHIKPGVKYAPPVDRAVKAANIKYAFVRVFSSRRSAVGIRADLFPLDRGHAGEGHTAATSSRSRASRRRRHDDRLPARRPSAPLVAQALVMPITTPAAAGVPGEVRPEDARRPTTSTPPSPGPYMVKQRPQRQGRPAAPRQVDRHRAQPQLGKSTQYRPAYLDEIAIEKRETTPALGRAPRRGRAVGLDGLDTSQPPSAGHQEGEAGTTRSSPGLRRPAACSTSRSTPHVKPFDNINIRKAIIAYLRSRGAAPDHGGAVSGADRQRLAAARASRAPGGRRPQAERPTSTS